MRGGSLVFPSTVFQESEEKGHHRRRKKETNSWPGSIAVSTIAQGHALKQEAYNKSAWVQFSVVWKKSRGLNQAVSRESLKSSPLVPYYRVYLGAALRRNEHRHPFRYGTKWTRTRGRGKLFRKHEKFLSIIPLTAQQGRRSARKGG